MSQTSPLTANDLSSINAHLKGLNELRIHISNAQQVGVDTSAFLQQHEYYTAQLNAMKQVYFPNKPN